MNILSSIKANHLKELKEFENFFGNILKTDHILIKHITNLVLRRKGKLIRPLLVILSAKLIDKPNKKTIIGASLVELIHTATLVHDDVVDNSNLRRNFFSIKALWHSKVAVLYGDYLLAKGLLLSVENNFFDLLEISSKAVKKMIEGELLQFKKSRRVEYTKMDYYKIIESKTASLMAVACQIGGKSVYASKEQSNILYEFGRMIGIIFQIKDDILDIEANSKTGKTKANDIIENKITLPLILALEIASKKEKRLIFSILQKKNKSIKDIKKITKFIIEKNGINNAYKILEEYKRKSLNLLKKFDDNVARKDLINLINFISQRNY